MNGESRKTVKGESGRIWYDIEGESRMKIKGG
jgi:hypothetical protein